MMRQLWQWVSKWWWLLLIGGMGAAIWLLPIQGSVLVSSLSLDPNAEFPQYTFAPGTFEPGDEILVTVTDNVPWTHVQLTANGQLATFVDTRALPLRQLWSWTWRVTLPGTSTLDDENRETELAFYRDCANGCQLRDRRLIEPYATAGQGFPTETSTPTKLCVVFPDPNRNWHGRSGWVVDLTYAETDATYWQVDALSQRVYQSTQKGLRVLVRVDFAPEQSLPHEGNEAEIQTYLDHVALLARDDRLRNVYGYIIGTGFNAADSNSMLPHTITAPQWYATLFNGVDVNRLAEASSDDLSHAGSVVQVIRAHNGTARILVGPVRPWNANRNGNKPFEIDVPWLNYMNEVVARIDQNTREASVLGIPLNGPDGFALNVPGRPYVVDANQTDPALEPTLKVSLPDNVGVVNETAQGGFQIYRNWLSVINNYPTTRGKPAYITSSNTFGYDSGDERSMPAQGYPSGWLTNALAEINQEPQIESLCWFLDLIPGDQRWEAFSLAIGQERMSAAAEEFDQLLRQ